VRLDRVLWVRGETSTAAFPPPTAGRRQPGADRAIERALKAANLILQAGGLSLVALDLADAPIHALRRIPMTTWLRLQKVLEGQQAAAIVTGPVPMSRSAGGVTLKLARDSGSATRTSAPLFPAIESEVRIQRARLVPGMGAPVRLTATAMVA
jgi:recombination protein RecA